MSVDRARLIESIDGPPLELVSSEIGAGPMAFPVVHILEGTPPAPPAQLVEGTVLDNDVTIFDGHGAAAKSTVATHVAVCVALDRLVFGTKRVHRSGSVLLCLPEDGEAGVRMILDAMVESMQLSPLELARLTERLVMVPDSESVNLTRDYRRLGETARAHNAVLVIFDPLRNLIGAANENDATVATSTIDGLRRAICREANAAVVICHHSRKPGKDADPTSSASMHDSAGSAAWVNSSRLTFNFSKKGPRIVMRATKSNRMPADLKHEIDLRISADEHNAAMWRTCQLVDANTGASTTGRSDTFTPGKGRSLNANEIVLLEAIYDAQEPEKRYSHAQWQGSARSGGVNDETFKTIKNRLIDAALAEKIATGGLTRTKSPEYVYKITANGRAELAKGEAVSKW